MSKVWVLGAGQLGTMLHHAGIPLNIAVHPIALDATTIPELSADDIVTPEIEHWPDTAVTRHLSAHPRLINAAVFSRLADRYTQKQLIDDLKLATAPWCNVTETTSAESLYASIGKRLLLKSRRGGYDGKGQLWLQQQIDTAIPHNWLNTSIAEACIDFQEEVSLVGMRDFNGNMCFYPLALNLHIDGVLTASIAPLQRLSGFQRQAEKMLSSLLEHLDYVGVMAMECFRVDDQLLINELAPRVHNSGHWTQSGASISQFENHLRAICGLPLTKPATKGTTVMINLLGTERDDRWLQVAEAELFWYGKSVRPGRKVGHINLCFSHIDSAPSTLTNLQALMPEDYHPVFSWVMENLG